MKTSDILSADLLDLLFEGRNKNYGAYDLRKTYNRRINLALAGTVFVCLLFIAGNILAGSKKNTQNEIVTASIQLESFKEEKKIEPLPAVQPEEKIKTVKYVIPLIVPDKDVMPEDQVKDIEELDQVKIAAITQDGKDVDIIDPPIEKSVPSTESPKKDDDIDVHFGSVQIEAQFEGGREGWVKYLTRSLNSELPLQNGAPPASYTVIVSFIVDRTGAISDVKAENDPGYGTKAEAIRVIQKGPNWKPAIQNGRAVIYRQKQAITFQVREE